MKRSFEASQMESKSDTDMKPNQPRNAFDVMKAAPKPMAPAPSSSSPRPAAKAQGAQIISEIHINQVS